VPSLLKKYGLRRYALAIVGGSFFIVVALLGAMAPIVSPSDPNAQDLSNRLKPPSIAHRLGTDTLGRDNLSRIIWGTRISLSIGFLSVLLATAIGTILGVVAGFYGANADWTVMRFTDIFMSLPGLLIITMLVAFFGPGYWMTVIVIGAVYWPTTTRIVRAEFLRLRQQPFVEAARSVGVPAVRQIRRHYIPNALGPLMVQMTLQLARAIVLESGLSYLGLGAQPPTPSWGNILAEGYINLRVSPWGATFAGLAIWLTTLAFNLAGDGLREAIDPTMSRWNT